MSLIELFAQVRSVLSLVLSLGCLTLTCAYFFGSIAVPHMPPIILPQTCAVTTSYMSMRIKSQIAASCFYELFSLLDLYVDYISGVNYFLLARSDGFTYASDSVKNIRSYDPTTISARPVNQISLGFLTLAREAESNIIYNSPTNLTHHTNRFNPFTRPISFTK